MATFCIQCAMEAVVKNEPAMNAMFNETPEQHACRVHPDPVATQARRQELEQILAGVRTENET